MNLKMAELQTQNIKQANEKQKLKIDAANHVADRVGKMKLETMRLQQSELVHRDKLTHEQKMKDKDRLSSVEDRDTNLDHQMKTKGLDLQHAMQTKSMDLDAQHRQNEMKTAMDVQQADSQRLHDLKMANEQARLAQESQFMKPEE
jgi:hypothetical protein